MEVSALMNDKADVCEPILRALPDWFGIEAAIVDYLADIEREPTWTIGDASGCAGFVTVVRHNAYTAEIHVMGIRPEHHRAGLGRTLIQTIERLLVAEGTEYLAVKTLSPAHPDPYYARTRSFYAAMGFRPVQEFPELWGPENPCLLMIKRLPESGMTSETNCERPGVR